jgi:hypothetical protein
MITNISTILYIVSTCEQHISNKILQTGCPLLVKLTGDGDFITFRYTLWLPLLDNAEPEDTEDTYVQKFTQDSAYFITGKFTMLDGGLLELVVSAELPSRERKSPDL